MADSCLHNLLRYLFKHSNGCNLTGVEHEGANIVITRNLEGSWLNAVGSSMMSRSDVR